MPLFWSLYYVSYYMYCVHRGARSKAAFLAYVQGGYKEVGGDKAPQQPAYTDMMIKSVTDPFKKAMQDVQNVCI